MTAASTMAPPPAVPPGAHPTVLATQQDRCDRIVADATQVFWTTRSAEERFPPSSSAHLGHVLACPVAGCPAGPTVIAQNQSHIDAVAIDAKSVYWTRLGSTESPPAS